MEREHRVFVASRSPDAVAPPGGLHAIGAGTGQALALFSNGDKYVGAVKEGHREGNGLYVYADGSGYKGAWARDALDGMAHPLDSQEESDESKRLHDLNETNTILVAKLKEKIGVDKKPAP